MVDQGRRTRPPRAESTGQDPANRDGDAPLAAEALRRRAPVQIPVWAKLVLLAIGLAFAIGAEWIRLATHWSLTWVLADGLPGVAFLACGVLGWTRRPDSRIGPLMVAAGFAWYAGTYAVTPDPTVGRLGYAFQGWYDVLLAWLVLTYPSGFFRFVSSRIAIGSLLAVLAIRSFVRFADVHQSTEYDLRVAADVDRFVSDQTFRTNADTLFGAVIALIAVAVLVLIVNRLRTETDLGRRIAAPMMLGGAAFASGIVVQTAGLSVANGSAERAAAWDLAQALTAATGSLVAIAFVLGLVRSRLARGAVADLVVELGQSSGQRDLESLLARVLRDPSLQIAYPIEGGAEFVDGHGQAVDLPSPDAGPRAVTRFEAGGRTIAALLHDAALLEQPELVRSVAAAAGLALENERLAADVRAQLDEVRRSRARIVTAGDAERRRIERDIHDGAQQQLVTVALLLQVAVGQAQDSNPEVTAIVRRAAAQLESALAELRRLSRGLHPVILIEEGLGPAIEALADRTPIRVSAHVTGERFEPEVEATAYFVVTEALANVVKHAHASLVAIAIERGEEMLSVDIVDDGIGGADPQRGSGLIGLEDRVAAAGGTLTVRSTPGTGTAVRVELPCR